MYFIGTSRDQGNQQRRNYPRNLGRQRAGAGQPAPTPGRAGGRNRPFPRFQQFATLPFSDCPESYHTSCRRTSRICRCPQAKAYTIRIPPHRPSRSFLPSFPRKRESRTVLPKTGTLPIEHGIPAYAGMTVVDGHYRSNQIQESCPSCLSMFESVSRLRGKDGREAFLR